MKSQCCCISKKSSFVRELFLFADWVRERNTENDFIFHFDCILGPIHCSIVISSTYYTTQNIISGTAFEHRKCSIYVEQRIIWYVMVTSNNNHHQVDCNNYCSLKNISFFIFKENDQKNKNFCFIDKTPRIFDIIWLLDRMFCEVLLLFTQTSSNRKLKESLKKENKNCIELRFSLLMDDGLFNS